MALRFATDLVPDIESIKGRSKNRFSEIKDEVFWAAYERAKPYSLIHITGFYNAYQSMRYIERNGVPGDIVECGCFLGGMGVFLAILRDQMQLKKDVYLFDTFEGFPDGEADVCMGQPAPGIRLENFLDNVRLNVAEGTGDADSVIYVPGYVEETLPGHPLEQISLLRLDTDFYNSTLAELEHLYPRLSPGGVLIIDDYGTFEGSRRATDEYFAGLEQPPLLNRMDNSVWAGVKPHPRQAEAPRVKPSKAATADLSRDRRTSELVIAELQREYDAARAALSDMRGRFLKEQDRHAMQAQEAHRRLMEAKAQLQALAPKAEDAPVG